MALAFAVGECLDATPHLVGVVISEEPPCPPPVDFLCLFNALLRLVLEVLYREVQCFCK